VLDRELSARELEAAEAQLTSARQDVERQQFYLQRIVEPNLADQAQYPRRLLGILIVAGISFCVFWIARTLAQNIWEHQA
jgi:capsular polysaccharide transport system permease protein